MRIRAKGRLVETIAQGETIDVLVTAPVYWRIAAARALAAPVALLGALIVAAAGQEVLARPEIAVDAALINFFAWLIVYVGALEALSKWGAAPRLRRTRFMPEGVFVRNGASGVLYPYDDITSIGCGNEKGDWIEGGTLQDGGRFSNMIFVFYGRRRAPLVTGLHDRDVEPVLDAFRDAFRRSAGLRRA